jgi:hypothetical protein
MPQIIAGQGSDLSKTVAQLVKELLENNWPTSAYDPLKSDIGFGMGTWDSYGDIDIHVNADKSISSPLTIGWSRSQIYDPVTINLFIKTNQENAPPTNMITAKTKIEEIIKDNAAALGQGITALRFDGWDPTFQDTNLKDVWKAVGHATAIYFRVKV